VVTISSANELLTDGTSWTRIVLKHHRWIHSRTAWRNYDSRRWTFCMDFSLHSPLAGSSASLAASTPGIWPGIWEGDVPHQSFLHE